MRLEGHRLACVRAGREVLRDLSFAVGAGECLTLRGPNGAGKTTLLRLVAGLLRPVSGKLALAGGDAERSIGEQAHYVGHADALKPQLSVGENLSFWARMLGEDAEPDILAALEAVGLRPLLDFPAAVLSAGQRRRLALARLVASPRPLWLLDEPLNALDADGRERLAGLIERHLASGGMAMAAAHGEMPRESAALYLGGGR